MEYIYYCVECGKFHFKEAVNDEVYATCIHCFKKAAAKTEYLKSQYELMSQVEKTEVKEKIKMEYTKEGLEKWNEAERIRIEEEREKSGGPLYNISGVRGRSIIVYKDYCIINTSAGVGSFLTGNATDGEKIIFYHDVVGIQYKKSGVTIGYLQLETASGQMNNVASNMFSENTFTFEGNDKMIDEAREYIFKRVLLYKQAVLKGFSK